MNEDHKIDFLKVWKVMSNKHFGVLKTVHYLYSAFGAPNGSIAWKLIVVKLIIFNNHHLVCIKIDLTF